MGQKVHPTGFRLGVIKGWQSRWFAERDYKDILAEDRTVRSLINKELFNASVSRIEIERAAANQVSVTIFTAKPGIVIGKSGEKVDKLRAQIEAKTRKRVRLNIMEIRQPELDAYLVARSIAEQLEKRIAFRRAMKQAAQKTMRSNAKGIKIIIGGRLGGAEIARSEKEVEGKIPLQTLRADIDYGLTEAHTTFGVIGIKVWIYKGDVLPSKRREAAQGMQSDNVAQPPFAPRDGGERRNDRRRGERSERGDRGDRGGRGPSERSGSGERSHTERGSRPGQGAERAPRPQGSRPPRQPGDRGPTSAPGQTERSQGSAPGQGQPQAERSPRPPRQPRPVGERPPRPAGERPTRQATGQPSQPPVVQAETLPQDIPAATIPPESTPHVATPPPAPSAPESGVTDSE